MKIHCRSFKKLEDTPQAVKSGDPVIVKMVLQRAMYIEPFSDYAHIRRFVMRD